MQDIQLFRASPPPLGLTVEPTEQAISTRDELIACASEITAPPQTAEENDRIAAYGQAMQTLIKKTEADGLSLRRPYNAEADKIKKVQDSYLDPLRPLLKKLGGFSAAWRTEQERLAEVARQERAAELVRLQDAERKVAEDARLAAEAARKAAESGDLMAAVTADIQAAALIAASAASRAATMAAVVAPAPEAAKTKGQSFKANDLEIEVLDAIELWNARPELCYPPTANLAAIRLICSADKQVPGLRLTRKAVVNFKATR